MHSIRLRHPWQTQWSAAATADAWRTAHYQRSFNCSPGLLAASHVQLVIRPAASQASSSDSGDAAHRESVPPLLADVLHIKVNACPVAYTLDNQRLRVDIQHLLRPHNHVEIHYRLDPATPAPPPLSALLEVHLEIA